MASDLWANVASGVVGGGLALAGQWVAHHFTYRRDEAKRKAEGEATHLADLQAAYVAYLVELNLKSRKTIHFVGAHPATDSVTDAQIREFINDFHLLASSDAYFKLRMLEKDPEGAKWIKEIGFADNELLQLGMPLAKPTPMDLFMAAKPAILKLYEFQEWLYTKRFPAS